MQLFIVRHGETELNGRGIIQCQVDTYSINKNGVKDANYLGQNLPKDVDIIVSSPLKRTVATASIISSYTNTSIVLIDGLEEMFGGNINQMTVSQFEAMKFNTAIAQMMTMVNEFYRVGSVTKKELSTLLLLLNPVAPHMTEEMWELIGNTGCIFENAWPEHEEAKTVENEAEIAVQINGKIKTTIKVAKDIAKEDALALGKEALGDKLNGTIVKEIYVPGRIINIVVK